MKTALIDGDVLIYRAAYKAEKVFDWGNDLYSVVSDLQEARGHYASMLTDVLTTSGCEEAVVVVSDPKGTSFRHTLYPAYKANRHKGPRKPLVFRPLRDELISEGRAIYLHDLEGDDVLGLLQDDNSVICTIDKDLKGIPGLHFNFDHKEDGIKTITRDEADRWHLIQSMAGDSTDGIPGIPGIGVKTAQKLLDEQGWTWSTVVAAYAKKDLGAEHALTMARLVKILEPQLWDAKAKKVVLWEPRA